MRFGLRVYQRQKRRPHIVYQVPKIVEELTFIFQELIVDTLLILSTEDQKTLLTVYGMSKASTAMCAIGCACLSVNFYSVELLRESHIQMKTT